MTRQITKNSVLVLFLYVFVFDSEVHVIYGWQIKWERMILLFNIHYFYIWSLPYRGHQRVTINITSKWALIGEGPLYGTEKVTHIFVFPNKEILKLLVFLFIMELHIKNKERKMFSRKNDTFIFFFVITIIVKKLRLIF